MVVASSSPRDRRGDHEIIRAANTYVSGKISRGKYTLVTRLKWLTRLLVAVDSAVAKNVHGSSAQYANSAYGVPSLGTRAIRER